MIGCKGYVGGELGWKLKLLKIGGMFLKLIYLSEIEESGILCVGVKFGDLWRNVKSEGSFLGFYWCWGVKVWGVNGIRYFGSLCCKWWVFVFGLCGLGV